MAKKHITIATHNQGKAKEFEALFHRLGFTIRTLRDYPEIREIEETGTTFLENAFQKAETIYDEIGGYVLADDSGLMVDALDGEPGVLSARYAGEPSNDENNIHKLLEALKGLPEEKRSARFHTTLVLLGPNKSPLVVEGNVKGVILEEKRGAHGFGYDPIFYLPHLGVTMAELDAHQKNEISHRAQAIKALTKKLSEWLG